MEDKRQIAILVVAATFVALFFVILIILFVMKHRNKMQQNTLHLMVLEQKQQQELFQAINEAELSEKERIAKNLHDEISMNLVLMKQNLSRHRVRFGICPT
jgi:signal transduction histidine kinase